MAVQWAKKQQRRVKVDKSSGASAVTGDTGFSGHLAPSKSEPSWHEPFPKIIYHTPLPLVGPFLESKESPTERQAHHYREREIFWVMRISDSPHTPSSYLLSLPALL